MLFFKKAYILNSMELTKLVCKQYLLEKMMFLL